MDTFIARLVQLVPPPKRPVFAGTLRAFRKVEQSLGMKLPDGYKRVVRMYGNGLWQDFWSIANPFVQDGPDNPLPWYMGRYAVTAGPELCRTHQVVEAEYPGSFPWPIYPRPGGLFPWALTDSGGVLYWLTDGEPESWPTIYDSHDCPKNWERFDLPWSELLYKTVTRECNLFRRELGDRFESGPCSDTFRPLPWSS